MPSVTISGWMRRYDHAEAVDEADGGAERQHAGERPGSM